MATNAPEEEIILVRGSAEHKDYMRHHFGWLKGIVNGLEDGLSISGRSLLLIFILYTTVKAGMTLAQRDTPWWLDIAMLAFQVCGLEGSIPGLSRLRETLIAKNTPTATEDAETIKRAIHSARLLNMLTGVEILLMAYSSHTFAISGIDINIAEISKFYGYGLLLYRLWKITSFISAMARMEVKKPKIISQAEYEKQQHEAEQEQVRMDNASIQASISEALEAWTKAQEQKFDQWSAQLAGKIQNDLAHTFGSHLQEITDEQARMLAAIQQMQLAPATVPTIDNQAIIQAVTEYLIPHFQAKFQAVDQAISRQNVMITEAVNQAKKLPENAASQATLRQQFQAKPAASNQAHSGRTQAEQNVIRLVPANASREELKAEAIRLRDVEGMSSYKIAERLGKPAKTVQSWLSNSRDTEEMEAIN